MKKQIVFKTLAFPTLSETFVTRNVIEALKAGFKITIITDKRNHPSESAQEFLLEAYGISEKISDYSEPLGKIKRKLKAAVLLANPVLFFYYIKYVRLKKKKSLSLLFRLAFYYPHRNSTFHVHFATALNPLLELKEIGYLNSNIIVTFHGYDAHELPSGPAMNLINQEYKKHVSVITVNSLFLKQKLLKKQFIHPNIVVIPIGTDFSIFKRTNSVSSEKSDFNIISIGRLVKFKGHEIGVRVVKLLSEKGYKVNYTIIGEGPEREKLESLVEELCLENSVGLLGEKNQKEIIEHLQSNHLFLLTSTTDETGRREDFGVVSIEAQAMELPVIGFRSGGFPETLVDGVTGILVEDKDVESMAEAVETLIRDKKRRVAMGIEGRKHVIENFSFEKTTKKYLDFY